MSSRLLYGLLLVLASCDPPSKSHAPGTVQSGGACQYDRDCAAVTGGRLSCSCNGMGGSVCTFTAVDLTCAGNAAGCPEGTYCTFSGNPAGTCVARAALGKPCDTIFQPCLEGLFCNLMDVCDPAATVGTECDFGHADCGSGLQCNLLETQCVRPRENGSDCSDPSDCLSQRCDQHRCVDLFCP